MSKRPAPAQHNEPEGEQSPSEGAFFDRKPSFFNRPELDLSQIEKLTPVQGRLRITIDGKQWIPDFIVAGTSVVVVRSASHEAESVRATYESAGYACLVVTSETTLAEVEAFLEDNSGSDMA